MPQRIQLKGTTKTPAMSISAAAAGRRIAVAAKSDHCRRVRTSTSTRV